MRRWYVPLTVLGLGSIGALLLTEWGRNSLRLLWDKFEKSPDSLQSELDRIQSALDRIAQTIDPHPELGQ